MIEQQKQRIEQEITKMIEEVDKTLLRKMQADMHYCAAKCCDNEQASLESVHRCIDRCSQPVNQAQEYVQKELEQFQGRLQRCVMSCNDDVKDKMPVKPTEEQISKYTGIFERCAVQCVDKHVDLLPSMFKTIKSVLSKGPNAIPQ
uniref:Hipothetical protein n=1 Tax=Corethrella appendiculata TaxID=1370023 RepID=U5EWL8_9DIPT